MKSTTITNTDFLTLFVCASCPSSILYACITTIPAMTAFVVAMAGMMFPAMATVAREFVSELAFDI